MLYSANQNSVNRIIDSLKQFETKLQRKVLRQGLRKLGEEIKLKIRVAIPVNSKRLLRGVKVKIKSYKRGRKIWMGVGYIYSGTDDWRTKVMAHSYDKGFRPYPKGRPTNAKGKGWRSGLRKLGGQKIYETKFMQKIYNSTKNDAQEMLYQNVLQAIKELNGK